MRETASEIELVREKWTQRVSKCVKGGQSDRQLMSRKESQRPRKGAREKAIEVTKTEIVREERERQKERER